MQDTNEIIYAIKIANLSYSGLKILDVKIGKTTNINSTLAQYKRGNRNAEILNLWELNQSKTLSECEKGIHEIAEKYAYEREGEKFIFLQESYKRFAENVGLLLKNISKIELGRKRPTIKKKTSRFARKGLKSITSQKEYRMPILKSLVDMGGKAGMREVLEKVKEEIRDKLTTTDLEKLSSGKSIRWINAVQWERQKMKEEGLLKKDSPRGIWQITEKGKSYYQSQK